MQILPVFIQPQITSSKTRLNFCATLPKDVSELKSKDFLCLPPKEIWARIKSSRVKAENLLGMGGGADVWKIEGTDYCVRIPHDSSLHYRTKPKFDLTEQQRINHAVAKLSKGVTIMPVIKGLTLLSDKAEDKEIFQLLDKMPQKAFDDLFLQIYHAEKHGMKFDSGYKNIIINPEENKLTAIDFFESNDFSIKNNILSAIYWCLSVAESSGSKNCKHLAGKLLTAPLNCIKKEPQREWQLELCGFDRLVDKVVTIKSYARILKEHFSAIEELQTKNADNLREHTRIIQAILRQLLGV